MWLLITAALVYLEVPLGHALLFGTLLVLQAALGSQLLGWLLPIRNFSILWLCGPGLVLGGAVSLLLFQLCGRGLIGTSVFLVCSGICTFQLLRIGNMAPAQNRVRASPLLLCGLSALALSSEFEWLLLVAAGLLASYGLALWDASWTKAKSFLIGAGLLAVLTVAGSLREERWWLITDDYKFFAVVANHLTDSGPFADWGLINFSRYHWLSYGWAGLLDFAALEPGTLTTLTRVMPLAYSLALASSLLLITALLAHVRDISFMNVLPVFAIVAMFRLDWSGTSTAGAITVLATSLAVFLFAVENDLGLRHRIVLYALFGVILLLTKMPSVLTMFPLVTSLESSRLASGRPPMRRLAVAAGAVTVAGVLIVASLPMLESIVGGFSIELGEQRGDELGRSGLPRALLTLAGRQSWVLSFVALALTVTLFGRRGHQARKSTEVLLSLAPLIAIGVVMDALVVGVANTNEYFSVPNYFLASLSLLGLGSSGARKVTHNWPIRTVFIWVSVAAIAVGIALFFGGEPLRRSVEVPLVHELLTDSRTVFCLVTLTWFIASKGNSVVSLRIPLVMLLGLLIMHGALPTWSRMTTPEARSPVSAASLTELLGPPDTQTAGHWLAQNSKTDDLAATNYLRGKDGRFTSDYSLAMWSGREFLVLGPRLAFDSFDLERAISASEEFAASASPNSAEYLAERGVDWFVVDLDSTSIRSWEPYAETAAMTWRFWVLKMK